MNATAKGSAACAAFMRNRYIDLNGQRITTRIEGIPTTDLADIGHEVAMRYYRSENAIEGFCMGWLAIGQQLNNVIRSEALKSKEEHCEAGQAMPDNVILFRARRQQ